MDFFRNLTDLTPIYEQPSNKEHRHPQKVYKIDGRLAYFKYHDRVRTPPYFYYSELFVSRYGKLLGVPVADVELARYGNEPGILSYDVRTNPSQKMLHLRSYADIHGSVRQECLGAFAAIDEVAEKTAYHTRTKMTMETSFIELMLFASLISHSDLHINNFAYFTNGRTAGFLPLFDLEQRKVFEWIGLPNLAAHMYENKNLDDIVYGVTTRGGAIYSKMIKEVFSQKPHLATLTASSMLQKLESDSVNNILEAPEFEGLPQEYKLALIHLSANNAIRLIDSVCYHRDIIKPSLPPFTLDWKRNELGTQMQYCSMMAGDMIPAENTRSFLANARSRTPSVDGFAAPGLLNIDPNKR